MTAECYDFIYMKSAEQANMQRQKKYLLLSKPCEAWRIQGGITDEYGIYLGVMKCSRHSYGNGYTAQ